MAQEDIPLSAEHLNKTGGAIRENGRHSVRRSEFTPPAASFRERGGSTKERKNFDPREIVAKLHEAYIVKWQQWFAENEAGTRSFSFSGSDVVYSLKERTDAKGRSHPRSDVATDGTGKPIAGPSETAMPTNTGSSIWKPATIASSPLLLLIGSWLALRRCLKS